jgi:hypothetical protein
MANGEGYPYECDYLKIRLKVCEKRDKFLRGEGCPWQSTTVVEYTK